MPDGDQCAGRYCTSCVFTLSRRRGIPCLSGSVSAVLAPRHARWLGGQAGYRPGAVPHSIVLFRPRCKRSGPQWPAAAQHNRRVRCAHVPRSPAAARPGAHSPRGGGCHGRGGHRAGWLSGAGRRGAHHPSRLCESAHRAGCGHVQGDAECEAWRRAGLRGGAGRSVPSRGGRLRPWALRPVGRRDAPLREPEMQPACCGGNFA